MSNNPELERLRYEIDVVDKAILDLLQKRSEIVGRVALLKEQSGLPVHQPERFAQMLNDRELHAIEIGVDHELVADVWNAIHNSSLRQQSVTASESE